MRNIMVSVLIMPLLLGPNVLQSDADPESRDMFLEYNLLDAVALPNDGVEYITDSDNFPVLNIQKEADIKTPYRLILPERLNDFQISGIMRLESLAGGYIFSIVNPLETIVQLGVHLSPVASDFMNITLYYTDPSYDSSRELSAFEIPYTKEWFNFAFKVLHDTLIFYLDCEEFSSAKIKRQPTILTFDSASTLFVGGYIFSIVNPLETIVQLGVHLSPVASDFMNITLYYTDPSYDSSRELSAFEIPYTKEWFNFAFKVLHDTLIFYLDCEEFSSAKIKRQPTILTFDSASTL
uniref:Putative thrombospondin-like protein n=1 Tax=Lutzomyia longipalpis TaxID=7200 RepID=A0A1B0EYT5_LUTLO